MFIERLHIEQVRNLDAVSINNLSLINCFIGDNGSGKTSLLESIAIVSQGRSFRHHKIQTVIQLGKPELRIFVECRNDNGTLYKLGIQRDRDNRYLIRINGETVNSLAELSSILPVLIIDASAFELLDGAPSLRCRFIDWAVFHVEHQFYECWRRFNRILKHRNSLLKAGIKNYAELEAWDIELAKLAIKIEKYRLDFLINYQPLLDEVLQYLDSDLSAHDIFYRNGWASDKVAFADVKNAADKLFNVEALSQQLRNSFARDSKYQRTHLGPQRADLQIRLAGSNNDVRDIYSRGQKKILIAAMKLAQAKLLYLQRGIRPILLLDDLPAELDNRHLQKLLDFIVSESLQTFISSVDSFLPEAQASNIETKFQMFHVERGRIDPFTGIQKQEIDDE